MYIWGRENYKCDTYANAFRKKEESDGTQVTSTDLCYEPWSSWVQGEKNCRMLNETCTTLSMARKQQILGARETKDIYIPDRHQAVKGSNIPR
jgi:hypothetical protein